MKRTNENPGSGAPDAKRSNVFHPGRNLAMFTVRRSRAQVLQPPPAAGAAAAVDPMNVVAAPHPVVDDANGEPWESRVADFVNLFALHTTELQLLKANLRDCLVRDATSDQLAQMWAECRVVWEQRLRSANILEPFPQVATNADNFRVLNDAFEQFGLGHNTAFSSDAELELEYQKELKKIRSNDTTKDFEPKNGSVSVFDPRVQISEEIRAAVVPAIMSILEHAILMMPNKLITSDVTVPSLAATRMNHGNFVAFLTNTLVTCDAARLQHICGELVVFFLHREEFHESDDIQKKKNALAVASIRIITEKMGRYFPSYIQNTFGRNLVRLSTFEWFGFQGSWEAFQSEQRVRKKIDSFLDSFQSEFMKAPQLRLKKHQSEQIINMCIQEYLPDDVVNAKQAGICGLFLNADPGTGKTLIALCGSFFIDWLRSGAGAATPKTLFILPTTALDAFIKDCDKFFNPAKRPYLYQFKDSKFYRLGGEGRIDDDEHPRLILEINNPRLRYVVVTENMASLASEGLLTDDQVDKLHPNDNATQSRIKVLQSLVRTRWQRLFIDESHAYVGRTSARYMMVQKVLQRKATYLMTGTAVQTSLVDIMTQLRLMRYQASLDRTATVVQAVAGNRDFQGLDTSPTMDEIKKWALETAEKKEKEKQAKKEGKPTTKSRSDTIQTAFNSERKKKLDEAILKIHHSIPGYRAIQRITKELDIVKLFIREMVHLTGKFDLAYFKQNPNASIGSKIEFVLDKLFGPRIQEMSDHLDRIEPRVAPDADVNDANAILIAAEEKEEQKEKEQQEKEEKEEKEKVKIAEKYTKVMTKADENGFNVDTIIDPSDPNYLMLSNLSLKLKRLQGTRNYGVDVRILTQGQCSSFKSRLTTHIGTHEATPSQTTAAVAPVPLLLVKKEVSSGLSLRGLSNSLTGWFSPRNSVDPDASVVHPPPAAAPVVNDLDLNVERQIFKDVRMYLDGQVNPGDAKESILYTDLDWIENLMKDVKYGHQTLEDQMAKLKAILKPHKFSIPPRYADVLSQIEHHQQTPNAGKVLVYASDRPVMLAFASWMLYTWFDKYRMLKTQDNLNRNLGPGMFFMGLYSSTLTVGPPRTYMVDQFRDNPHFNVMVTTYEMADTGLNFQAANLVIHMQQPYLDTEFKQATARAYRLDQTRDVTALSYISDNTGEVLVKAIRLLRERVALQFDQDLRLFHSNWQATGDDRFDLTPDDNADILDAKLPRRKDKKDPAQVVQPPVLQVPPAPLVAVKEAKKKAVTLINLAGDSDEDMKPVKKEPRPVPASSSGVTRVSIDNLPSVINTIRQLPQEPLPSAPPKTNPDDALHFQFRTERVKETLDALLESVGNGTNVAQISDDVDDLEEMVAALQQWTQDHRAVFSTTQAWIQQVSDFSAAVNKTKMKMSERRQNTYLADEKSLDVPQWDAVIKKIRTMYSTLNRVVNGM
jgi:hypothetical protein